MGNFISGKPKKSPIEEKAKRDFDTILTEIFNGDLTGVKQSDIVGKISDLISPDFDKLETDPTPPDSDKLEVMKPAAFTDEVIAQTNKLDTRPSRVAHQADKLMKKKDPKCCEIM